MYKVYHHSLNDYPFMRGDSYKIYNFKSRGLALLFARLLCLIIDNEDIILVFDATNNTEELIGKKSCFEKFQIFEEVMSCQ